VSTCDSEKAYRGTARYWRFSKYLVPQDLSALSLGGAPAPRQLVSAHDLANSHPDLVQVQDLGSNVTREPLALRKIFLGQLETVEFPPDKFYPQHINHYRDCGAVGRHSAIVGPDRSLVADYGYYVGSHSRIHQIPLGRWNPAFWRYCWLNDLRYRYQIPAPQRIDGTVAVLNNPWCHNYYHWLLEILPRIELLRRGQQTCDHYLIECQSGYQRRALELLGIPKQNIIQPNYALHLRADKLLRPTTPDSQAWHSLAQAIKQNLETTSQNGTRPNPRRIYISRRQAAHRKVVNEDQLEQLLSRYGFESHSFESTDFARQVQLLDGAEAIVAVHGAALANLIFAKPGARVVEIYPMNRYNLDCFPRVSAEMGHEHVSVTAKSSRYRQNLHVELDDIAAALDLLSIKPCGKSRSGSAQAA